ncbi:MAG TPA: cupredoxin domain-containing protein [Baekduia sp.]|nr:cupredoxin domain-containing protein [Baekduia sp.]
MMISAHRGAALTAVLAAGAAAALPALAPAASKHHHAAGKTRTVGVQSDFYDPAKITVHVGDKIKWVWHPSGFSLHDVYVDSGPSEFNSPTQAAGSFSYKFKKAGTYKLYCTQHEADMTMTVTVKKAPKFSP